MIRHQTKWHSSPIVLAETLLKVLANTKDPLNTAGHAILKAREAIDRAEKTLIKIDRSIEKAKHSIETFIVNGEKVKKNWSSQSTRSRRKNRFTVAMVTSTSCWWKHAKMWHRCQRRKRHERRNIGWFGTRLYVIFFSARHSSPIVFVASLASILCLVLEKNVLENLIDFFVFLKKTKKSIKFEVWGRFGEGTYGKFYKKFKRNF